MLNLPWLIWVIIGVAALTTVAFVWYLVAGGEEEEDENAVAADALSITAADGTMLDALATTASEALKTTARESRMMALKMSLERSLDSREGKAQVSARDRMNMPWFMLVGADGSGKKTILANTGLPLPWGPPLEVDSQRKDAGKWWLFDQAVVLEAPAAAPGTTAGTTTLPPGQTVADASVGWNTLLHMLRRERPDSPLNGIIVTISCADLLGARNDPERMEEQADRINGFLTRTRNFLGVRLPLHVLVTKCDTLPGFRSFAEALPELRRHDIFGWANPHDPESRFDPGWIDTGFTQLYGQLSNLRDEVLAAPETVRDSVGVFVFDSEFADLQDTLKTFVARIMNVGERRPTLFFRGFYFTGDAVDDSAPGEIETTLSEGQQPRSMTRLSTEIAAQTHHLVFCRSLFAEKIFKEAGLARPMSRWRLSPDRRVVAAQAAAIIIALVGGMGLWMSVNGFRRADRVYQTGLKAETEQLTRVLSGVAIDLDEVRQGEGPESPLDRRARDAAVLELVAQMRDVPTMGVRSPFIPTSWFSPLPRQIKQSMMAGIQTIVLPVTRQRLEERASRLLGTSARIGTAGGSVALAADEFDATDPRVLTTYLTDVRTLSRNIERYNSLADSTSGSVAELSALLDYLFGEQIASDSALATKDFEDALKRAVGPRIVVPTAIATTVANRAVAMVTPLGDQAARQLAPRTTAALARGVKPEDDLRALNGLAALVKLLDPKEGVVATVSDSAILGIKLARAVQDSIAAHFARVALQIARDSVSPDSTPRRLRTAIERLYTYRMMDRSEDRIIASDIRPNERLRWDVGRLELALALPSEFLRALVTVADGFPGESQQDRMRRALGLQLRARVLDVAASAQRFTPLPPSPDWQLEVKSSGANLDEAAKRIVRLAQTFDTLQARSEGRRLLAAGSRQAEHALAMAQRVFDSWTLFQPRADSIARWQGVLPLSFRALGVTDSTSAAATSASYRIEIGTLAKDVSPAVRYLRSAAAGDSSRVPVLVSRWESIAVASARYDRGEATSTLGMLLYFVRDGMGMSDLATCTARASEPDTTRPSNDVFVILRRQFRAAMVSRCGTTGSAEAVANYQRLRTLFQTKLAGRYPFMDSTSGRAPEAEPSAVREFFRQYDAFRIVDDVSLRSHPVLSQTARPAIAFIEQLGAVRALFAPFTDSASSRTAPAYSLLATAKVSPDTLPTYLLDLEVGGRQATIDEAGQEHAWRSGDSVKVILSPLDTAKVQTLYAAGGAWAGLRFAQKPPVGVTVRLYHADTKLPLGVPVFPTTAPEILIRQR